MKADLFLHVYPTLTHARPELPALDQTVFSCFATLLFIGGFPWKSNRFLVENQPKDIPKRLPPMPLTPPKIDLRNFSQP